MARRSHCCWVVTSQKSFEASTAVGTEEGVGTKPAGIGVVVT